MPICTSVVTIVVHGFIVMTLLLEVARFAIVGYSDGEKSMRPAIASHMTKLGYLFVLSSS